MVGSGASLILPGEHSAASPSSAERWMECPGSVREGARYPEEAPSVYADEGTVLHKVLSYWAVGGSRNALGQKYEMNGAVYEITEERMQLLVDAWAFVEATLKKYPDAILLPDQKVDLGTIMKGMFGTADIIIFVPSLRLLLVMDFKFGGGVQVYATGNKQMLLYGLGALKQIGVDKIDRLELTIIQPRFHHYDTWAVLKGELKPYVDEFRAAAARTLEPNAPLKAGDHCRFCRAKPHCAEIRSHALKFAQASFTAQGELVDPDTGLTVEGWEPAELVKVYLKAAMIEDYLTSVKAEILRRLRRGVEVPGVKLVNGKRVRGFSCSPAEVIGRAVVDGVDPLTDPEIELLSVAQLEKRYKEKQLKFPESDLVSSVFGDPVLALEKDPRPAVTVQPVFEVQPEGPIS